ncbi:hypothetical protein [Shewanella sp. MBTL60-007]|nr:hypothetical protein [Shewanella sp. MBTL60-007]GIU29498.1 hypothetical protein TUM3792_39330 [Shewanella sp. MBTL60-007]
MKHQLSNVATAEAVEIWVNDNEVISHLVMDGEAKRKAALSQAGI